MPKISVQVKETLYYVVHYEKIDKVKIDAIKTIERLNLVNEFYESLQMIMSHASGKLSEITEEILILKGYFTGRGQEERRERIKEERKKKISRTHIVIRPSIYDLKGDIDKSIVLRDSLVQDREKDSLIKQVHDLCAKGKIISETTNMKYQELEI